MANRERVRMLKGGVLFICSWLQSEAVDLPVSRCFGINVGSLPGRALHGLALEDG